MSILKFLFFRDEPIELWSVGSLTVAYRLSRKLPKWFGLGFSATYHKNGLSKQKKFTPAAKHDIHLMIIIIQNLILQTDKK